MLTIQFFDGRDEEDAANFDFTTDGFRDLIATGIFRTPHITLDDGRRGIDLRIFKVKVEQFFRELSPLHPQHREILSAIKTYRYLVGSP